VVDLLGWAAGAAASGLLGNAASAWAKQSSGVKWLRRNQRKSQRRHFAAAACMALERAARAQGRPVQRLPYQFGGWTKADRNSRLFWSSTVTVGAGDAPYAVIFIPNDKIAVDDIYVEFK
jgi:hypothetical protein